MFHPVVLPVFRPAEGTLKVRLYCLATATAISRHISERIDKRVVEMIVVNIQSFTGKEEELHDFGTSLLPSLCAVNCDSVGVAATKVLASSPFPLSLSTYVLSMWPKYGIHMDEGIWFYLQLSWAVFVWCPKYIHV